MTPDDISSIGDWLTTAALDGADEAALFVGFSQSCIAAGCPLSRGLAIIDTLHPQYEGRAITWENEPKAFTEREYEPVAADETNWEGWQQSPLFHMLRDRMTSMRCRLTDGEPSGYPAIEELREAGQTDYLAVVHRLRDAPDIQDVDAFYARWTTQSPDGFSDSQVEGLIRLGKHLALALRLAAQTRLATTLVETYLGRDPGKRVLEGRIARGAVEQINAVLWFSDLSGYTRLSEEIASDQLIPLLNDYAEAVISSVEYAGGDVLKLIGDGVLAIFAGDRPQDACLSAEAAGRELGRRMHELTAKRGAEGLPTARIHLGLHVGDVYYGNIGSPDRLDFTVVGPAVNEVSRIASMCHSVDQPILCSSEFVALLPPESRENFVSVGRFALRGVGHSQHLYTVDPSLVSRR